jgi:hypothetical protein
VTFELRAVPKPPKRVKEKRARMKACNPKRQGHLFPKNVDEARRDFIRRQACAVTGRVTGEWVPREPWMPKTLPEMWRCFVVCAHVKSRGSGGADKANMIPLDSRIHDWQGLIGWKALVKKLKLEAPAEIAAEYERRYLLEAA